MFKKFIVATAAAVSCSGIALSAQATSSTTSTTSQPQTTTSQSSTAAPPAATAQASTTFTGCVYREKDVPGRAPNVAERAGIAEDYILADIRPGGASSSAASTGSTSSSSATAGATGTSGTMAAGGSTMYKLEFADDSKLKAVVGKRVEVMGRIDAEPGDNVPRAGQPTPQTSQTDRIVGHDKIDLPEFELTSIREVSGTCPATPTAK